MPFDPQLLQSITWDSVSKLDLADDVVTFAQGALERLTGIAQEHADAISKINADASLSDVGKQTRRAAVDDAAQRNVAQHSSGVLAKTSSMISDMQKLMTPTPLPKDSGATTALLIERRQVIRDLAMDVLNVGIVYLDAARVRDDVTLAAIDTAPSYELRFQIADDVRQQGKFVRGSIESPDAAAQLKEITQLDAMLRSVISDVEASIGVPDPLSRAATGPMKDQGGPRASGNGASVAA